MNESKTSEKLRHRVLIEAGELQRLLEGDAADSHVIVLDVRWQLDRPDGKADYLTGHIPGAVYVDLEHQLSAHDRHASEGRHPLPSLTDLQRAAQSWGLNNNSQVIVTDSVRGQAAARAWWLLSRAGVGDVRVLNGGNTVWVANGGTLTTEEPRVAPGNIELCDTSEHLPALNASDAEVMAAESRLFDARARERYLGEVEPIDPVAGHIPGAINLPVTELLDDSGFKPNHSIESHLASYGVTPGASVGVYCGSGITAAQEALALAAVGIHAHVYAPSWSGWLGEGRPAETQSNS